MDISLRKPISPRDQSQDIFRVTENNRETDRSVNTYSYRTPESGVSSSLLNETPTSGKTAKWGINWFRQPLQLPLFTLCGILLAVGHHILYWKLDGHTVSNDNKLSQQAVKQ